MITENDIIRVWPQLIEVTREYARAGLESQFAKGIEGHCEACGVYSTNLMWDRNLLACPECRGGGRGLVWGGGGTNAEAFYSGCRLWRRRARLCEDVERKNL